MSPRRVATVLALVLVASVCVSGSFIPDYDFLYFNTISDPLSPPPLRDSAVGISPSGQYLYVLGGTDQGGERQQSFYTFNFNNSEWQRLNTHSRLFSGHCYGQYLGAGPGVIKSQEIYFYTNSENGMRSDLVRFNFSTVEVISNESPNVPYDGGCTVSATNGDGDDANTTVTFYVYGGTEGSESNCSSELWSYSSIITNNDGVQEYLEDDKTTPNKWRLRVMNGTNQKPEARSKAGLIAYNESMLFMFGGRCDGVESPPDLWQADLEKKEWTKVTLAPGSGKPAPRSGHAFVFDFTSPPPHQILMYGGYNQNKTLGDVWRFDFASASWIELSFNSTLPTPRHNFGFSFAGGRLALFGGSDEDYTLNNELWQLVLNDDCLSAPDCECCVVERRGCGWCDSNNVGYKCVAGAEYGAFLNGSCAHPTNRWTNEFSNCPNDSKFPRWVAALLIIFCVVILASTFYFIMAKRLKLQYVLLQH